MSTFVLVYINTGRIKIIICLVGVYKNKHTRYDYYPTKNLNTLSTTKFTVYRRKIFEFECGQTVSNQIVESP